ncbi:hypothetical protein BD413DRAFT_134314 [Trametes elegans]|nr:hypothetical protein BD413DRAFT_134314 [Trametes elegans]
MALYCLFICVMVQGRLLPNSGFNEQFLSHQLTITSGWYPPEVAGCGAKCFKYGLYSRLFVRFDHAVLRAPLVAVLTSARAAETRRECPRLANNCILLALTVGTHNACARRAAALATHFLTGSRCFGGSMPVPCNI